MGPGEKAVDLLDRRNEIPTGPESRYESLTVDMEVTTGRYLPFNKRLKEPNSQHARGVCSCNRRDGLAKTKLFRLRSTDRASPHLKNSAVIVCREPFRHQWRHFMITLGCIYRPIDTIMKMAALPGTAP
jgi:hypothetical protein